MRLASYNLRKCVGTDRRRDPLRSTEVIAALDADIVALQEVDRRLGPRPAALPGWMIEAETDLAPVDLAQSHASLGWHGQSILVRKDATIGRTDRIELPGLEPRGAVLAEVALPGAAPLRVVGVHLGLLRRWRLLQLHAIRAHLDALPKMPTAILGDFNEWSAVRGTEPLAHGFALYAPGRSYHATRPVAALDRVALSSDLALEKAGVVQTPLARRASDHLPVWVQISPE